MARRALTTSPAVTAARAAVAKLPRAKGSKKPQTMVYLLEVRVPLEHVADFRSEHLDDSLTQYGSCDVIDATLVEGEL